MQARTLKTFETTYVTYSPMLYSIALEISPSEKDAQEILITTFKKFHRKNLIEQIYPGICIVLIKLIIETARELLKDSQGKTSFEVKKFASTPLLHKLLCEQMSLEKYCQENKLTRAQAAKQIREEFISIRNKKEKFEALHLVK